MAAYKILQPFRDKYTGKFYSQGIVADFAQKRADEILDVLPGAIDQIEKSKKKKDAE